jgi:hypothetical protein
MKYSSWTWSYGPFLMNKIEKIPKEVIEGAIWLFPRQKVNWLRLQEVCTGQVGSPSCPVLAILEFSRRQAGGFVCRTLRVSEVIILS